MTVQVTGCAVGKSKALLGNGSVVRSVFVMVTRQIAHPTEVKAHFQCRTNFF